jgi:hypothetical protein
MNEKENVTKNKYTWLILIIVLVLLVLLLFVYNYNKKADLEKTIKVLSEQNLLGEYTYEQIVNKSREGTLSGNIVLEENTDGLKISLWITVLLIIFGVIGVNIFGDGEKLSVKNKCTYTDLKQAILTDLSREKGVSIYRDSDGYLKPIKVGGIETVQWGNRIPYVKGTSQWMKLEVYVSTGNMMGEHLVDARLDQLLPDLMDGNFEWISHKVLETHERNEIKFPKFSSTESFSEKIDALKQLSSNGNNSFSDKIISDELFKSNAKVKLSAKQQKDNIKLKSEMDDENEE